MDFSSILHVFTALNKYDVQSMAVGGTAVAFYGYYRISTNMAGEFVEKPDIDIWYNPTYQNYYNLLKAIEELGKNVTEYRDEIMPDPKNSFFRFEFDDYTLDLLPRVNASLKFSESFIKRAVFARNGLEISVISREDLIEDKKVTGRQKDLSDIEHLKGLPPLL
ncbi:hypothetical protein [Runella sp.]|uniref:hypothetical protein n=1 Tax=Runella sp. TaxID=1960881 RepID=UPI003D0BAE27